jgi:hypothetical protein
VENQGDWCGKPIIYKISSLINVGTVRYLRKYLCREREFNDILEKKSLKIYVQIIKEWRDC